MLILTGGAGFIGSNILKRLNAEGEDRILVVDNLSNVAKRRNLEGARFLDYVHKDEFYGRLEQGDWDGTAIAAICHQGACTDTTVSDAAYMMRTNFEHSKCLLDFALRRNVRMVYASSAAVYGHTTVAVESPDHEDPLNVYGASKLAFDNHVRRVCAGDSAHVVGLRYFNVYGPGEDHKGKMASMAYQLSRQIQDAGTAYLFGGAGTYGAGEQARDFIFVNDIVEANLFFLRRDPVCAIVNLGSGVRSTWNDLARVVIEAQGAGELLYKPFPAELEGKYQFDLRADLSRLRALGFTRPMTTLRDAVRDYVRMLKAASRERGPLGPHLSGS